MDALIDVIVRTYAPLPERSLAELGRLRNGVPQWTGDIRAALVRAHARLASAEIEGVRWFWPEGEQRAAKRWRTPQAAASDVRLLAPFDPIVWDRRRFELFWNWPYRFEAYVPAARRVRGYYALPLLWRDDVIGWANLSVNGDQLHAAPGYVSGRAPRDAAFKHAFAAELGRIRIFLGLA